MPGARSLVFSVALGLGVALYVDFAFGWPTFLTIAIGAVMTLVSLLIAASVGEDPEEADRAWKSAAPDLVSRITRPEGPRSRRHALTNERPRVSRDE
jgi:hypothetical protein